ncbi:MAG TPA: type II secretion system F family protein [Polyangiaceae bacterium]
MSLELIRWICIALGVLTVVGTVGLMVTVTPVERPKYGYRGAERKRAMDAEGMFAWLEPAVRYVAAIVAALPLDRLRVTQTYALKRADDVLGLSADELSAMSIGASVVMTGVSAVLLNAAGLSLGLCWIGAAVGLLLPSIQVTEIIRTRAKTITRALPPAIEIAAMCMSAGLDFPGSLRMLTHGTREQRGPLGREFEVILEHLEFGHTRKVALQSFAERVPSRAVLDFVNAVIQAEQKGNPLARVLQIQGRMLSMRRSVLAEEAAARAGVLMIIPMVFLVTAILLLLMGPFIVSGIGW